MQRYKILMPLVAVLLSGCVSINVKQTVEPDGFQTVVIVMDFSELRLMMESFAEENPDATANQNLVDCDDESLHPETDSSVMGTVVEVTCKTIGESIIQWTMRVDARESDAMTVRSLPNGDVEYTLTFDGQNPGDSFESSDTAMDASDEYNMSVQDLFKGAYVIEMPGTILRTDFGRIMRGNTVVIDDIFTQGELTGSIVSVVHAKGGNNGVGSTEVSEGFKKRVCERVLRRFGNDAKMMERIGKRLQKWGFSC